MGVLAWFKGNDAKAPAPTLISVTKAHERSLKGDLIIIDVRQSEEWARTGRPQGSIGIPLASKDFEVQVIAAVDGNRHEPIALSCRTGGRASQAAKRLQKVGFSCLYVVDGGMMAWLEAKLPID